MGEQPCLWSTVKLKFSVANEGEEPLGHMMHEDGPHVMPEDGPTGGTEDLLRVLNMGRLEALEQLTLDFSSTVQDVSQQNCIRFLQIILENSPKVRKLSLESLHVASYFPSAIKGLNVFHRYCLKS